MKNVIVNGETILLNQNDVLGAGGEGTVFKTKLNGEKVAVKIYTKPSKRRGEKLEAFFQASFRLPTQVISPIDLVFDTKGVIVGFTMPLLPQDAEAIRSLSNKKYRQLNNITTKDVAETFLASVPVFESVHPQGLVIGDCNDINLLSRKNETLFIDTDSWQLGNYPCPVGMEEFIDPALYGIDLSKKPVFTTSTDWYAFAVLLFKSLLLTHPYGGTHKSLLRIVTRAENKVTVFDPSVRYPKVAFSPDILDDDLLETFDKIFSKGQRGKFPRSVLEAYYASLVPCQTCATWYPASRGLCPVCSAKTLVIVTKPIVTESGKKIITQELIRTSGPIVFAKVIGDKIYLIAQEEGQAVLYEKKEDRSLTRKVLFTQIPGARFELFGQFLAVNRPQTNEILLIDVAGEKPKGILRTQTDVFKGNRKASFKANAQKLFRIAGSSLMEGTIEQGRLIEKPLRNVVDGQTWFSVDEASPLTRVFGLFQVFRDQIYWMIEGGQIFDLKIEKLEETESLIDLSVKYSSQGVLLTRLTEQKGKEYLRFDQIGKGGDVVLSKRIEKNDHPYPTLHGNAYTTGVILRATDDGLITESVADSKMKTFEGTDVLVEGGDSLIRYDKDLVVVKQDQVLKLETA